MFFTFLLYHLKTTGSPEGSSWPGRELAQTFWVEPTGPPAGSGAQA